MGFPSPTFTIIVFPFLRFFISFQCLYKKGRLLWHKNIKIFFLLNNNNMKINSVKNSGEWICMHTKSAINYSLGLEKYMLYFTPIIRLNTSVYPFLFSTKPQLWFWIYACFGYVALLLAAYHHFTQLCQKLWCECQQIWTY